MKTFFSVFKAFLLLACLASSTIILSAWATAPSSLTPIAPSPHLRETTLQIGKQSYTLEVTQTPEEYQLGLMGRKSLPPEHGMLFTFFPPEPVKFWMRHTLIPLDMLFVADGKIIYIQEAAPPCPEKLGNQCPTYGADRMVDYVIELPAHTVKKYGIKVGTKIGKQP